MAVRFMRHALRLTGTTLLATLVLAGTALAATLAPAAASPAGHAGTGRNLAPGTPRCTRSRTTSASPS